MTTDAERNKRTVARFYQEALVGRDLAVLDQLLDARFIDHAPAQLPPTPDRGRDEVARELKALQVGLSDLRMATSHLIGEGDRVTHVGVMSGTHSGPLLGVPATGRPVRSRAITFFRLAGDRIVDRWAIADVVGILAQVRSPSPEGGPS